MAEGEIDSKMLEGVMAVDDTDELSERVSDETVVKDDVVEYCDDDGGDGVDDGVAVADGVAFDDETKAD
jgi:hypothetical protein